MKPSIKVTVLHYSKGVKNFFEHCSNFPNVSLLKKKPGNGTGCLSVNRNALMNSFNSMNWKTNGLNFMHWNSVRKNSRSWKLLTEFLLAQGNFAEEAPSELLRLSQDARNSAKERGVRSTPPPKPGWVNPGQILQWVEDRSPQDPVIDYEKQRRAARFVSHARIPGNPLPPFHRVKDHIAAFRKKEPGAVSPEPISKPRPRTAVKPPQAETSDDRTRGFG